MHSTVKKKKEEDEEDDEEEEEKKDEENRVNNMGNIYLRWDHIYCPCNGY